MWSWNTLTDTYTRSVRAHTAFPACSEIAYHIRTVHKHSHNMNAHTHTLEQKQQQQRNIGRNEDER